MVRRQRLTLPSEFPDQSPNLGVLTLSPVPLYTQIKDVIRSRILDGTYAALAQMPSEVEMMKAFQVSRITVRQALGDLQKEGLLFKIAGKGTFVAKPKAVQSLGSLKGFAEAMGPMGHETFSRVIGVSHQHADRTVADRFGISTETYVTKIQRLRYLNRQPISLDVTFVPIEIGERLAKEDLVTRDIFSILENEYGYTLGHAQVQIEAMLADAALAHLLAIEEGAPLLRIERLTYTSDGLPLDYEHLYYRGDSFQYRLTVARVPVVPRARSQEAIP